MAAPDDDPVAVLHRWTDAGAVWRVIHQGDKTVTVGLYQCDGGEEVDRISSADPRLLQYLSGRTTSED
jgi:hypothetical protein